MEANLNAIGIISTVALTVIITWRWGDKHINKRIIVGLLLFFIVAVLNLFFSAHGYLKGVPFHQWVIPGVCLFIAIVAINNKKALFLSACGLAILSFLLSGHYVRLVHKDNYTGNPQESSYLQEKDTPQAPFCELWHSFFTRIYGLCNKTTE